MIVDAKLEEQLLSKTRKIPCTFHFESKVGEQAKLTAKCKGEKVTVFTEQIVTQAKTSALTYDDLKTSLSKLNDTVFVLTDLTANFEDVFLPKSVLNNLRREVLEQLINQILKNKNPTFMVNSIHQSVCNNNIQ